VWRAWPAASDCGDGDDGGIRCGATRERENEAESESERVSGSDAMPLSPLSGLMHGASTGVRPPCGARSLCLVGHCPAKIESARPI
jgi:hypothetical protein